MVVPTNHSSCRKTRSMDLLYGIRILTQVSFVLSQFTRLTKGQTDGHLVMTKTALHKCVESRFCNPIVVETSWLSANVECRVFRERELTFTFAICHRPSVCLSVGCLLRSCTLLRLLKFSAMFLRHLVPWSSVTFR